MTTAHLSFVVRLHSSAARAEAASWASFASRRGGARLHGPVDAIGHVLDRLQDLDRETGDRELPGVGLRVEAVAHVVVLGRREPLQGSERHVVVREDQPVGGDERTAGADPDRGEPEVVEPFRRRSEPVPLLQLLLRELVVGPHPLVGEAARSGRTHRGHRERESADREPPCEPLHAVSLSAAAIPERPTANPGIVAAGAGTASGPRPAPGRPRAPCGPARASG